MPEAALRLLILTSKILVSQAHELTWKRFYVRQHLPQVQSTQKSKSTLLMLYDFDFQAIGADLSIVREAPLTLVSVDSGGSLKPEQSSINRLP